MESTKFSIKKNEPKTQLKSSSVFNQDSDEEKEKTSHEKFDRKYGGNIKTKDKRLIEAAMAQDPTVFEYDAVHEDLNKKRNEKTKAQKKADEEKKPKYVAKIKEAHYRREMEKLIHDEHTYQKERLAEADAFADKEVYITEAYREQIEERNKFRKDLEKKDAMDEYEKRRKPYLHGIASVFNRTFDNEDNESELNDFDKKYEKTSEKKSYEHKKYERGRERNDSYENQNSYKEKKKVKTIYEIEEEENEKRMNKIREILKQRNSEDDIMEARKRYFERLANDQIVPPLV